MARVTLEDCVKQFSISVELLGTTVSDEHIRAVSKFWEWRTVAPHMLEAREIEEVDVDQKFEQEKRHKSLQKWKSKLAFKATYKKLSWNLLGPIMLKSKLLASLAPHKGLYITSYSVLFVQTLRQLCWCTQACLNLKTLRPNKLPKWDSSRERCKHWE